jgi:hypothetical protein
MRQIVQVYIIMALHDFLAARMLRRHIHIALTCHLLATRLLFGAHPRVRNQTVRPRYTDEQQEHGCGDDLVKESHSVLIIDAVIFDSAACKRLHAIGKKVRHLIGDRTSGNAGILRVQ